MKAPQRPAASVRLRAWRDQHLYGLFSSLGRMTQRPFSTLLTVAVMALAVALPLALRLALGNVERFAGSLAQARDLDLFLRLDVDIDAAQALAARLAERADVQAVVARSPEQGLSELRQSSDIGDALDLLDHNPLPWVLSLTPAGDGDALAAELRALPEVQMVRDDAAWRQRLDVWLAFGRRFAWALGVLLAIGALLVVGNTVRLELQSRAEEVQVLQLLGASDAFIRRPMLYLGACYGLAAGMLALLIVVALAWALADAIGALGVSYGIDLSLRGLSALEAIRFILSVLALGWLGAFIASARHLRRSRT